MGNFPSADFLKINFFVKFFQEYQLGPNSLKRLSADVTALYACYQSKTTEKHNLLNLFLYFVIISIRFYSTVKPV